MFRISGANLQRSLIRIDLLGQPDEVNQRTGVEHSDLSVVVRVRADEAPSDVAVVAIASRRAIALEEEERELSNRYCAGAVAQTGDDRDDDDAEAVRVPTSEERVAFGPDKLVRTTYNHGLVPRITGGVRVF